MRPLAQRCEDVRGHVDTAQAGGLSWHSIRTALEVIKYDGENSIKKGSHVLD